jgi:hypothetical protein
MEENLYVQHLFCFIFQIRRPIKRLFSFPKYNKKTQECTIEREVIKSIQTGA